MIRVLDIYKTNGRVENGNNVQIYTNADPIAQEWLILPVDADNFRIVPRSNMRLSLTTYGSDSDDGERQNVCFGRKCVRQYLYGKQPKPALADLQDRQNSGEK